MKAISGIRARITLAAGLAMAVATCAVVAITWFAMNQILHDEMALALHERLDRAAEEVQVGNYDEAIDLEGNDIMQVIDADGKVIAASHAKAGYAPIVDADDGNEFEVDDFDLVLDEDVWEAGGGGTASARVPQGVSAAAGAAAVSGSSATPSAQTSASATSASDDDDDDDDGSDDDDSRDDDDSDSPSPNKGGAQNAQVGGAAGGTAPQGESDSEDERDDDDDDDGDDDGDDDDDVRPAGRAAASSAGNAGGKASKADDDDDDDGKSAKRSQNKGSSSSAKAKSQIVSLPVPFTPVRAWAAAAESSVSVDASDVLGDSGPYLIMKREVESPDGMVTLAAATSLAAAGRGARTAAEVVGLIMCFLLVLVVLFAWFMTGRTLRPVEQMRLTAASISANNLGARIDVPAGDRDLARLAETFNELLSRVQRSFDEQKRFISDASHELKSPVAATGIMLEAMRSYPESIEVGEMVEDLSSENHRMQSILEDLLALTRYDEGRLSVKEAPTDIMDIVLEEASAMHLRPGIVLDTTDVEPVVCAVDGRLLAHAVRNLLDNASRFARNVVRVSCTQTEAGDVLVQVDDDGPGVDPADWERVFGRFVRLDGRDSGVMGGTGLGLPVARSSIEAQGGTLTFVEPRLGGASALITLPAKSENA